MSCKVKGSSLTDSIHELTKSQIGTPSEWRAASRALLAKETKLNELSATIAAERRALPMVPITKTYTFSCPDGPVTLKDLFGTKSQLIIYHYMFEPTAEEGCQGCAFMAANFPDPRHLAQKDTALVVVSRAPIGKITAWREKNFWDFPWVSSLGTEFNYDFHVTLDDKVAPVEYGFESKQGMSGEQPGLSVFKLVDGQVYHTYSSYSSLHNLAGTYVFLDLTPAGRQEGPDGPAEFKTPAQYAEEAKAYNDG
ncbi:hypothetical protein IFR05_014323 [Cadophora sp. M221]|nr:hypothetical protein IFR05_014323 [Cadophora sp. M221]